MKKIILSMIGVSFLFLSCNRELIEFQEDDSFSFSTSTAQVTATCEPDLEALELSLPETVTVTTKDPECSDTGGAFLAVDIAEGDLASLDNDAYCVDLEGFIGLSTYTFDVYSSYDEELSGLEKSTGVPLFENADDFDRINWLLNQDIIGSESPLGGTYTFGHIQWAIWEIIEEGINCTDDCDYLSCNPIDQWDIEKEYNESLGLELVARAEASGEGFVPQCGQKIAIVLASTTAQSLIITTDVPEKEIPCEECSGNVTELTLQYNGIEEAYIEVETKDEGVNDSKIVFEGTVAPGGMFTINGNDENGTFGEEIKVYVDGDYVKIKTDCSESIGPGLIVEDIEVISGMSLNGGELCPIPCDECKGGVTSFTVEYTGSSPAQLKIEHDNAVLFNDMVSPGQEITLSGSKDDGTFEKNDLYFTLDGQAQSAPGHDNGKIHMSCSKPFYVGLPIGDSLVVTAGRSKDNGPMCEDSIENCDECKGGVTSFTFEYTGSSPAQLKVEHDDAILFNAMVSPGQEITLSGSKDDGKFEKNDLYFTLDGQVQSAPEHDNGKIHMSCSKPFYVGLPIGDSLVVTAGTSKDNGPICEDTPPFVPDCQECKGGVTSFTVVYNGMTSASLKIEHDYAVLFNAMVSPGQEITLNGSKDDGKFEKNDLYFTLDGQAQSAPEHDNGKIHMSCSKPFYVGLPIGDSLVVIAGTSKDNGPICEETPPSPECDCEGGIVSVTFTYSGNVADLSSDDDNASFTDNGNGTVTLATFDGDKLSNPDIFINGNNVGEIHASCSDNILGLSYGNLTVVEYVDKEGNVTSVDGCSQLPPGSDCECDGGIVSVTFTYNGNVADLSSDDDNASFTDNGNGTVTLATFDGDKLSNPDIFINGNNVGEIHASCSDNILGLSYGNLTVVEYLDKEGGVISIATCPTDPVECACDGKIVKMSVVYDGPNGATVTLGDADDGSNALQTFTNVQSGDLLEGNIGDVGNWWYWSVDGNLQASIHTSCSDDILGNVDASKSIFGNLGNYPDPADDVGNTNDGTFLVTSHTDDKGNTCSLSF